MEVLIFLNCYCYIVGKDYNQIFKPRTFYVASLKFLLPSHQVQCTDCNARQCNNVHRCTTNVTAGACYKCNNFYICRDLLRLLGSENLYCNKETTSNSLHVAVWVLCPSVNLSLGLGFSVRSDSSSLPLDPPPSQSNEPEPKKKASLLFNSLCYDIMLLWAYIIFNNGSKGTGPPSICLYCNALLL